MIGVEECGCDTCVYKTVAAKMAYLYVKADHHRDGGPFPSEVELEGEAATLLGAAVATERDRRGRDSAT